MKAITATMERFPATYAWRNRILRVDLSDGRIWVQPSLPDAQQFLGARGLAAKIVWDEYPEPVDPFDPRNPFMVMPGTMTGTRSPYSGRTNVCAFSPQGAPYSWFSRASIGADWGAELKKAGYDGIVVTGASDTPVQIVIRDDEVSVLPADDLWGLDTIDTQEATQAAWGKNVKTLAIGPAGEHLSRIATVQTASTSVAGQGGFGAVMGSKKLKAISVIGSDIVPVADPERLQSLYRAVGNEVRGFRQRQDGMRSLNERLAAEGGKARVYPCTNACPTPCSTYISGMRSCVIDRKLEGGLACVSGIFGGGKQGLAYDWQLPFRDMFDLNMYANRLGLNHWDILVGIIPWLRVSQKSGLVDSFNGQPMDWNSLEFWAKFLHDMAYREGMGDAIADGGWRAAYTLDLGVEIMRRYYTGWGYSGHWDGHAAFVNHIVYPFWIVGALHWAMDTRDPASSTHGYVQGVMYYGPFGFNAARHAHSPITWDHMRGIGEKVYGRADTLDPLSGYEGKAIPGAYHAKRSVMKDCLPTDDQVFPLIYGYNDEDHFMRVDGIDGPDVDGHLFQAGTGLDRAEFERAAERVLNMERAVGIRHWGRDRKIDERVIPSFEYTENWVNPEIGEAKALDRAQFMPVMDEYYQLLGWDVETGWPTRAKLESLDLGFIYDDMVAGAKAAKERLPELPPVEPVKDIHRGDPFRADGVPASEEG
ncbi:MAG: hypothetical protein GX552_10700 [Chloroflexi bacterium]|jgi:aldehyde:ferredoxin oxidoreductase|nr:hypothetical protein [Chloroflexota bacterium]